MIMIIIIGIILGVILLVKYLKVKTYLRLLVIKNYEKIIKIIDIINDNKNNLLSKMSSVTEEELINLSNRIMNQQTRYYEYMNILNKIITRQLLIKMIFSVNPIDIKYYTDFKFNPYQYIIQDNITI